MIKIRSLAVSAALFMAFGAGCVVVDDGSDPVIPGAYEACSGVGASCLDGTTCINSPLVSRDGVTAALCSRNCTNGSQCVAAAGRPVTCAVNAATGIGACYENCNSNVDCRNGTVCRALGGQNICVPPL